MSVALSDWLPGPTLDHGYIEGRVIGEYTFLAFKVKWDGNRKVQFQSMRGSVDISSPFGEAMLEILAVFGKLETKIAAEKSKDEFTALFLQMKSIGEDPPPIQTLPDNYYSLNDLGDLNSDTHYVVAGWYSHIKKDYGYVVIDIIATYPPIPHHPYGSIGFSNSDPGFNITGWVVPYWQTSSGHTIYIHFGPNDQGLLALL